jgi:hypothetical protein
MAESGKVPDSPLDFIRACVREGRIYWTYHVNMRLRGRLISREAVLRAVDSCEIIESYPEDKYLPSYLIYTEQPGSPFHVLFAMDTGGNNVRIVTAYRPSRDEWEDDLRTRRKES